MKSKLRIVSRSSKLALKQVEIICQKIKHRFDFEIIKVQTQADKLREKPLYEFGGKGLFIKELEDYLIKDKADIAIHSLKDMETILAKGTELLAVAERKYRNDVLISNFKNLSSLPENSVIGTSSPRRTAFIKTYRKDIIVKICRGNVDTRLKKLHQGRYDALILSRAGMERLNHKFTSEIPISILPPSVGQGVIAIQSSNFLNEQDSNILQKLTNHEKTYYEILAERSFIKHLNGSCRSPISSLADINKNGVLKLQGYVVNLKGTKMVKGSLSDNFKNAINIGEKLAKKLIKKGAKDILAL